MSRLLAIACLFAAACPPPPASVGAASQPVPRNSAQTCTKYCQDIGLPLASVVIMADNVGCVCNAQPAPASAPASAPSASTSAAAAGGLAAIMIQEEEAAAAQRQQQQQQRR